MAEAKESHQGVVSFLASNKRYALLEPLTMSLNKWEKHKALEDTCQNNRCRSKLERTQLSEDILNGPDRRSPTGSSRQKRSATKHSSACSSICHDPDGDIYDSWHVNVVPTCI